MSGARGEYDLTERATDLRDYALDLAHALEVARPEIVRGLEVITITTELRDAIAANLRKIVTEERHVLDGMQRQLDEILTKIKARDGYAGPTPDVDVDPDSLATTRDP